MDRAKARFSGSVREAAEIAEEDIRRKREK